MAVAKPALEPTLLTYEDYMAEAPVEGSYDIRPLSKVCVGWGKVSCMFYDTIKDLKPEAFKRLTGVPPDTFALMREVLQKHYRPFGRPPALSLENQLLVALMYWREYRTMAHIAATYQVGEATVFRIIRKVESQLMADKRFHLPGKKALRPSETVLSVVVVDATECPCERPKKNRDATTAARRSATPRKHR